MDTMKRFVISLLLLLSWLPAAAELPYAEHGWNKEEAAAHLLGRFTFGARPGESERVAQMGLERWLDQQLTGAVAEPVLGSKIAELPEAYQLNTKQMLKKYPPPNVVRKMAEEEGLMGNDGRPDRQAVRKLLEEKGMRPYRELGITLFAQKLVHARHSENGLREVLTDFWFNHFNVALSNNRARTFILSYERDVIRPNALGDFRTLLGGTAKHPAMLLYLDNANSTAGKNAPTTAESMMDEMEMRPERRERVKQRVGKRKKGLNENYARELMELHTLGVDGGYAQEDVVEVARAFTGWTTLGGRTPKINKNQAQMGQAMGVKSEGDFLFASMLHDAGQKKILGHTFAAGGGLEEGEKVLNLLAAHPSTARHLAEKLATRFICDKPDPKDVQEIAQAYQRSNGDIKKIMRAVAHTDGFWDPKNRNAKVKSPFELVVSANRALDGDLYPSRQLYGWMAKMGQPLYNYQAPTGFPDKADYWVSSATVLNRVNFALHAARGMVPGFLYEPRDSQDLRKAVQELLPYRDTAKTTSTVNSMLADSHHLKLEPVTDFEVRPNIGGRFPGQPVPRVRINPAQEDTATMIGLILGTPEFQRR
jgi:uncharacterized protein (DUF1800 family)